MSDPFYRAFEDRYRGSRETIIERQRAYLPFLEPLAALYPRALALDLGCGRGEWLELTAGAGFAARGVDLDDGMLAACRERGLDVQTADAIATLRELDAGSVALVSAFHLVEHIAFEQVRALIGEALRVLQPGGLLILETPNPENLVVGASSFYRDPSHLRPLPAELLAFATEFGGFTRNKVVRLQEDPALRQARQVLLHQVLDGVSPDYAVVAQKAGQAELMARFDAAFDQDYGLSLPRMAGRFDEQTVRTREALAAAEGHIKALGASLAALDDTVHQSHLRQVEIAARLEHTAAHAAAKEEQIVALLQSRSWRITAPLRESTDRLRALRAGWRERGLAARARAGLRQLLLGGARLVVRNRYAKRAATAMLAPFPGLQVRLRAVMLRSTSMAPGAAASPERPLEALSPRERRLRDALARALDQKDA